MKEHNVRFLLGKDLQMVSTGPRVFLRHDIDADLLAAKKMSDIEHDLGIKSTYFVMIRSCVYNLFTENNFDYVKEIIKNKHDIGLHFDLAFCKKNNHDFRESVKWETGLLEGLLGVKIASISYHQPDIETIQKQLEFENLHNVYNFKKLWGLNYYSDSNLDTSRIENFIHDLTVSKGSFLSQLLIHPMWWINNSGNSSTEQVWVSTLLQNFENCQTHLMKYERAYGSQKKMTFKEQLV